MEGCQEGSETSNPKIEAARLSVLITITLAVLKFLVGVLSNSLAVISSSIDSFLDIGSSTVNYISIKKADEPADKSHPYGHGKIENIASIFQVILIAITGCLIIYKGIIRLSSDQHIHSFNLGFSVMLLSCITSFLLSIKLKRVSTETESLVLLTDSLNFKTDGYLNLAVMASLILSKVSGSNIFDAGISVLIGSLILYPSGKLFLRSFEDLTDKELPTDILCDIEKVISNHKDYILGYHKLRTRRAGSQKLIDLHIVACKNLHLYEAHNITELIEKEIKEKVSNSSIVIHMEPCTNEECQNKVPIKLCTNREDSKHDKISL